MKDSKGVAITVGCRIRQRNVFDPGKGALLGNAGQTGTVKGLGRTRAVVQFDGRCKWDGFKMTDEGKTDRVHAQYLEVLPATEREQT